MKHQPDDQRGAERSASEQRWAGWIDPMGLNDELRKIICGFDSKYYPTESEEARRTGITRPHVHNLYVEPMVLTFPLVVRWCNGSRVKLLGLVEMAAIV